MLFIVTLLYFSLIFWESPAQLVFSSILEVDNVSIVYTPMYKSFLTVVTFTWSERSLQDINLLWKSKFLILWQKVGKMYVLYLNRNFHTITFSFDYGCLINLCYFLVTLCTFWTVLCFCHNHDIVYNCVQVAHIVKSFWF